MAGIPKCKFCNDTGTQDVPLFTSVEKKYCYHCNGGRTPPEKKIKLPSGCVIPADDRHYQWIGGQFKCPTCGVWHARSELMQAVDFKE